MSFFHILLGCIWISIGLSYGAERGEDRGPVGDPTITSPTQMLFRAHLRRVAALGLKDTCNPSIFVCYSWDDPAHRRRVEGLCEDLVSAGIPPASLFFDRWTGRPGGPDDLHQSAARIVESNKVILVGTRNLKTKYEEKAANPDGAGTVSHEISLLRTRMARKGVAGIIPAWFEGRFKDVFPQGLQHVISRHLEDYPSNFFDLLWDIYQGHYASPDNPFRELQGGFARKRPNLRTSVEPTKLGSVSGSFPQSLRPYNAFLDRTDRTGLSYLDVIFDGLFMDEDVGTGFSTITLCATGMGGVGKTTLATEYAHHYRSCYDAICWMDASSKDTFARSCFALVAFLGIPIPSAEGFEGDDYLAELIRLINVHLPRTFHHCLLVVDNIEDAGLIAELAPGRSHILCTSRSRDWLRGIDIDVFKPDESVRFLQQMTGFGADQEPHAHTLAAELDHLPLALAQAAAYIRQQGLASYELYLALFREQQRQLLEQRQLQASLNRREAVVFSTWDITMRRLSPTAQQLMVLCAYLSPTDIPLAVFEAMAESEAAAQALSNHSMVRRSDRSLAVHRMVQLVTRVQLEQGPKTGVTSRVSSLLGYLSLYWEKLRDQFDECPPGSLLGLYRADSGLIVHLERLAGHLAGFSAANGYENANLNSHLRIANSSMLHALGNSCYTIRDDIIAAAEKPDEAAVLLREALEKDGSTLTAKDYDQLAALLPKILPASHFSFDLAEIAEVIGGIEFGQRKNFIRLVKRLLRPEDEEECFESIIKVLSRVDPREYGKFGALIKRLVPDVAPNIYRYLIISILVPMTADRRNTFESMVQRLHLREVEEGEEVVVMRALADVPAARWRGLTQLLLSLTRGITDMDHYAFIITTLAQADIPGFREFDRLVKPLLVEGMREADMTRVIVTTAQCPPANRRQFVEFAQPYFVPDDDGNTKAWQSTALFKIDPTNHARFSEIVQRLISPEMDENERWYVAEAFSAVPVDKGEAFVGAVQRLYTPATSPDNQTWIIRAFSTVEPENYEEFVVGILPFFAPNLENEHRAAIVQTASEIKDAGERKEIMALAQPLIKDGMNGYKRAWLMGAMRRFDRPQWPKVARVIGILPTTEIDQNDLYNTLCVFPRFDEDKRYLIAEKAAYLLGLEDREDEEGLREDEIWLRRIVSTAFTDDVLSLVKIVGESM
jgi:hypothetical protein